MAKVLVTGGAGFIGSHVVDHYLKKGYKVAIVDSLNTGRKENINKKARFYHVNITNKKELRDVFEDFKPNFVNHHAANPQVRTSIKKPIYDAKTNILGSINLIDLAKEFKVKKFIYINSGGAGYGEPKKLPVPETHPIAPLSPYGASKHVVEDYLNVYNFLYGLEWVSLRYANIYGPRQDPHGEAGVIAIFIGRLLKGERPKIFGDGNNTRDYVYIDDAARINLLATSKKTKSKVFNVGTNKQASVNEVFSTIAKALKSDIKPIQVKEAQEVEHIRLDIRRAKRELGWQPKVSLKQGIEKTVSWSKKEQNN